MLSRARPVCCARSEHTVSCRGYGTRVPIRNERFARSAWPVLVRRGSDCPRPGVLSNQPAAPGYRGPEERLHFPRIGPRIVIDRPRSVGRRRSHYPWGYLWRIPVARPRRQSCKKAFQIYIPPIGSAAKTMRTRYRRAEHRVAKARSDRHTIVRHNCNSGPAMTNIAGRFGATRRPTRRNLPAKV
jgi:hypothetical protein